jgi:hypothetical protein
LKVKEKAKSTVKKSIELITSATSKLSNDQLKDIPNFSYLTDVIKKERNKSELYIPNFHEEIPPTLKQTLQGLTFYRGSTFENGEKILLFFSDFAINYAKKSKTFLIDGTFKSVPRQYYQLLTIHTHIYGKTIPTIFALLSSKTEKIYLRLFKLVKSTGINMDRVVIDLELALKNALEKTFNPIEILFCNFHFVQCLWRRLQSIGLSGLYKNDIKFARVIRMYLNLAFFPMKAVSEGNIYIIETIKKFNFEPILFEFGKYFCDNFLVETETNTMKHKNLFSNGWNCFERVIKNLPRTNNSLEAWHKGLNATVYTRHPNLGAFLHALQMEEEKTRLKLKQLSIGFIETNKKSLVYEEKLRTIVLNFENLTLEYYFEGLENINVWKFVD